MKVALAQLDLVARDVDANIKKAWAFAKSASEMNVDLFVLPEVFCTGFFFLQGEEARNAGKKGEECLREIASKFSMHVCGSFASLLDGEEKPTNRFQLWSPEARLLDYDKIHLFSFAGEDKRYRSGEDLVSAEVLGFRVRPLICYDLRFDYCFSQSAEVLDLFIVPANWPSERHTHWQGLLKARAIDSQAFVVGVNRVGCAGKLSYEGGSMVVAPNGDILGEGSGVEGLIVSDIELSAVQDWRGEFSSLKDRRVGLVG